MDATWRKRVLEHKRQSPNLAPREGIYKKKKKGGNLKKQN